MIPSASTRRLPALLRSGALPTLLIVFCGCGSAMDPSDGPGSAAASSGGGGGDGGSGGQAGSGGGGGSGGGPPAPTGEVVWSRRGDGLGAARAVAADKDGNVVIAGVFRDTLDFGAGPMTSAGENDLFVARFDEEGACAWSRSFGGALDDGANAVAFDAAGNALVTGAFQGDIEMGGQTLTNAGGYDTYVIKLDSQGDALWARSFGGPGFDVAFGIAASPMGDIVVMGSASTAFDFGGGVPEGSGPTFVVRLNGSGDYVSGRLLEPNSTNALTVDKGDNVVLGGSFSGTMDLGTGPLVSQASTDGFIARFDPGWKPLFAERIGDGAYMTVYSVATDAQADAITGGMAHSNGVSEALVALDRYSPQGEAKWSLRFGAAEYAAANSVAVDGSGNIVVAGYFRNGTLDFGCGLLESPPEPDKDYAGDMFLAKLDPAGACLWSKAFGGPGNQFAIGVAVDATDHVSLAGDYQDAVDFGGGPLKAEHYPEPCAAKFRP